MKEVCEASCMNSKRTTRDSCIFFTQCHSPRLSLWALPFRRFARWTAAGTPDDLGYLNHGCFPSLFIMQSGSNWIRTGWPQSSHIHPRLTRQQGRQLFDTPRGYLMRAIRVRLRRLLYDAVAVRFDCDNTFQRRLNSCPFRFTVTSAPTSEDR